MAVSVVQRAMLDRQADRIERAFSKLALPIRILGGEVSGEAVRYHLSPHPPASLQELEEVASAVAESLGEPGLSVLREREKVALSIPVGLDAHLRLLPLLNVMGGVPKLHAVLGMSEDNTPLVLNLARDNLLIQGPTGCGKSELLRTVLFSLALNNRPSQLQFLGIDLGGRELAALDALPHTFAELATEQEYAGGLLLWLKDELERRKLFHVMQPDILLVIDGVGQLVNTGPEHARETLRLLAQQGKSWGIHLALASRREQDTGLLGLFRSKPALLRGCALARPGVATPGRFVLERGRKLRRVQIAWLPVHDLQAAVELVRQHSRGRALK